MPGGRPGKPVSYSTVEYKEQPFLVGTLSKNDQIIKFICNKEDEDIVKSKHWYVLPGNYIGFQYSDEGTGSRKVKYLHTFLLENSGHTFLGDDYIINHINEIGYDNRRSNLREITRSFHNRIYQKKNKLTMQLPDGITLSEIPRNIHYEPEYGNRGDRFIIEIKGITGVPDLEKKTTSSKAINTRMKLEEAIDIKNNHIKEYPIILEYFIDDSKMSEMKQDYNNIIAL